MSRRLVVFLFLYGCAAGPQSDLQYIKQARSIAAEWAMVNAQAEQGKLTQSYVRSMHSWLVDDLRSASSSLTEPRSRYGEEIRALLAEPPDAPPSRLQRHADALKRIEKSLESA